MDHSSQKNEAQNFPPPWVCSRGVYHSDDVITMINPPWSRPEGPENSELRFFGLIMDHSSQKNEAQNFPPLGPAPGGGYHSDDVIMA